MATVPDSRPIPSVPALMISSTGRRLEHIPHGVVSRAIVWVMQNTLYSVRCSQFPIMTAITVVIIQLKYESWTWIQSDLRLNSHAGTWKETLPFGPAIQNYKGDLFYNVELNLDLLLLLIAYVFTCILFMLIMKKHIFKPYLERLWRIWNLRRDLEKIKTLPGKPRERKTKNEFRIVGFWVAVGFYILKARILPHENITVTSIFQSGPAG